MEDSDDSRIVEEEVRKFVEWIRSGKIEVRINIIGGNKT
jgi:Holliday junction resolvase RusA-like endonuclease